MTTKYGAGAWTGKNPIGPSKNFVSPLGINPANAKDHPVNATELTKVLSESPGSGRLVSVPEGITITLPNSLYGKTVKSGFVLTGPGNIKWQYYGPVSGYMLPMLNLQEDAALSGLGLVGGGGYGHYGQGAGPCAVRCSGQKRVIVENVDLTQFRGGGIWFGDGAATITRWDDDTQRNIVRHVKISHIQQYGFGYGCGQQGNNQSFLIEASILELCRHLTMSSGCRATDANAYELRYCILGEAVYANSDSGPASIQSHQVDVHGGGWNGTSYRAGKYLWVHHCDFSANNTFSEKPNVCIRGRMVEGGWALIEKCWTKKRHGSDPSGAYSDPDTLGNNRICLMGEQEGAVWLGPKAFSSASVTVKDNWYGPDAPPDTDPEPPPPNPGEADIQVTKLEAPVVVLGKPYSVTATVENTGNATGSRDIVIYWLPITGSPVEMERKTVTLAPGEVATVVQTAKSTAIGDWTFKCDDVSVVLKVVAAGAPRFEISAISPTTSGASSVISVTVKNTGDAPGTARVAFNYGVGTLTVPVDVLAGGEAHASLTVVVGLV